MRRIRITGHVWTVFMLLLAGGCRHLSESSSTNGRQSWTLFRGDVGLSGYADVKLPDKPSLLWTYRSEARTASSPLVYGQTAYWCDKRGKIYGVDNNGHLCFNYDFRTAVDATPMIRDSILYIGRIDGFMSAVSLVTRDTLWHFETTGQISASPNMCVYKGKQTLVFGSYDHYLYCLDRETGREINRFASDYYINGAVALWKDHFISGGCDAWLRIINGTDGTPSDSLKLDAYIPASPAIDGDYCYMADHSGNVYEMVLVEGKIDRHKKIMTATDNSSPLVSVPAVSEKRVYILSNDRNVYAIDRRDGRVQWKYMQKGPSGESSPVICRDRIVCCSKNGIISMLEYDTGEQITSNPAVIEGRLYILTAKGTLFCFG